LKENVNINNKLKVVYNFTLNIILLEVYKDVYFNNENKNKNE
jgi:hypothetical protein